MSKCLRCGATSEWIQGKVPDEPAPESQWQPIETAPKDGTSILLGWSGVDAQCGRWVRSGYRNGFWADHGAIFTNPTHWQPLPAPPIEVKP